MWVSHLCLDLIPLIIVQLQVALLVDNIVVKLIRLNRVFPTAVRSVEYTEYVDGLPKQFVTIIVLIFFLGTEADDIVQLLYTEGKLIL